jgi:alpha-beta hydrolase superfamily lysophospholipase
MACGGGAGAERAVTSTDGSFEGVGGTAIAWRRVDPADAPRGVVVVAHGYAEHFGRYEDFARHLASRGLAVVGLDHRGHGRSGGPRGHCLDFDEMVQDLRTLVALAESWWPGVPRVLFGHSMGGVIAFLYLLRHPDTVRAGALSCAAFAVPAQGPAWQLALATGLAAVAPRFPFTSNLDERALARDPAVGRAYVGDPLVHRRATAGFVRAFRWAQARALRDAHLLAVPLLILQGDCDRLVTPAGSAAIAARLRCEHELVSLAGYYHELLNEPAAERAKVVQLLDAWFDRYLDPAAVGRPASM